MGFWDWLFRKKDDRDALRDVLFAQPAPDPTPEAAHEPQPSAYGIENAIELMRTLPMDDDPDLVLRVVRKTLRSTGVSVEEIIVSARRRESALSASVEGGRAEIEQLEREIAARRGNVERTEAQLAETRSTRECLEEALQNETKVGPRLAQEAARLQAQARAAMPLSSASGSAARPRADAQAEQATGAPSQSIPAPRSAATPRAAPEEEVRKKSFVPKLHGAKLPPKPATPEEPPSATGSPDPAAPDPSESLPRLSDEDDDLADEPTSRWLGRRPYIPSRKR